jgi:hypothetical protein
MDIKNKEKPLKILSFQQNQGFYVGGDGGIRTHSLWSSTLCAAMVLIITKQFTKHF